MGKLIAFGVITSMLGNTTQWSYRIPFALQWMWFPFMATATWLAPESPWWLVKKGRNEEAGKVLERLCTAPQNVINPQDTLAMIARTIRLEQDMNIQGSYADCFKGENLRRTEISIICWGCQILPGFAIQNYITYFFTLAGLSPNDSFKMSLGMAYLRRVWRIFANILQEMLVLPLLARCCLGS
jgi:SP family general alpha glucoside:H+ symporter-like MFS transporter